MDTNGQNSVNNICIFDRKKAELSGIYEVIGFTDTAIVVTCKSGNVSIDGSSMKIDSFDSSSGKLTVIGDINGLFYYEGVEKEKKKKLRRIFGQ